MWSSWSLLCSSVGLPRFLLEFLTMRSNHSKQMLDNFPMRIFGVDYFHRNPNSGQTPGSRLRGGVCSGHTSHYNFFIISAQYVEIKQVSPSGAWAVSRATLPWESEWASLIGRFPRVLFHLSHLSFGMENRAL